MRVGTDESAPRSYALRMFLPMYRSMNSCLIRAMLIGFVLAGWLACPAMVRAQEHPPTEVPTAAPTAEAEHPAEGEAETAHEGPEADHAAHGAERAAPTLLAAGPFVAILLFVVFFALLSYQPATVLFGMFVAYAISGFAVSAWQALRRRPAPSS